jgi:hypothetical protein
LPEVHAVTIALKQCFLNFTKLNTNKLVYSNAQPD